MGARPSQEAGVRMRSMRRFKTACSVYESRRGRKSGGLAGAREEKRRAITSNTTVKEEEGRKEKMGMQVYPTATDLSENSTDVEMVAESETICP
mmetsp:Transcript_33645/g.75591  ORF Transcript_33645/g.75591 Transcript_33645/m.75591 type:complete len:94 (+) Transcript_33645:1290-1571(+)|eukprot:764258-Hanusia_phi.AAC.5